MSASDKSPALGQPPATRRDFLWKTGGGLGGVALTALLAEQGLLGAEADLKSQIPDLKSPPSPLAPRPSHHAPSAKAVIQIFCPGGLSQVDTWDYKPELIKRAGKPFDPDGKLQFFASKPGACQPGFWPFQRRGQSGLWMSDLFPRLATCADDLAFIHSMTSKSALHGPGMFMMNSGFIVPGFPSMGSWITYGLGSETDNLPAYVVLPDPRGLPPGGVINWGAGFLPAVHQGTTMEAAAGKEPITQSQPRRATPQRAGSRSPHFRLRTRRPTSTQRPRGHRSRERNRGDQKPLSNRRRRHRPFRQAVPARPTAHRTRRPLRPDLLRR
jgi:hypothetical protein